MSDRLAAELAIAFVVFCRIGACFMLLPGISGERLPPQLRLFLAIAFSLAVFAGVDESVRGAAAVRDSRLPLLVIGEVGVGLILGFLVRLFYLALEFSATAMANYAGYGSVFMQSLNDDHSSGPFSEFITLSSIVMFFVFDLHVAVVTMLYQSYTTWPLENWQAWTGGAGVLKDAFTRAFALTLQLSAPLLVFSITINIAFGLLNKIIPQIPIYLVSVPFVMAGGLLLLFQTNAMIVGNFTNAVASWIGRIGALGQ